MAAEGSTRIAYSLEEKIAFVTKVDQLLRAGLTKRAAAEAAGTNWASYTNWVTAGIRPGQRPVPVVRSREEKTRLVAAVQSRTIGGQSIGEACREVGISEDRFYAWRKQIAPPPMRPVEVAGEVTALVPVPQAALAPAESATIVVSTAGDGGQGSASSSAGLCLVAPGGYRIEGLGVETAAALLRALA